MKPKGCCEEGKEPMSQIPGASELIWQLLSWPSSSSDGLASEHPLAGDLQVPSLVDNFAVFTVHEETCGTPVMAQHPPH